MDPERAWFAARAAVAGRRRDSRVIAVVDLLAAVPLLSATTLARALGLAVRTAISLLDSLVAAGVAVEVTHRAKRRLFGLTDLTPLRAVARPPDRPDPTRGRGRPPHDDEEDVPDGARSTLPPLSPIEWTRFDYSELEAAIAHVEQVTRQTRRALDALVRGNGGTPGGKISRGVTTNRTASVIIVPGIAATPAAGRTADSWTAGLELAFG